MGDHRVVVEQDVDGDRAGRRPGDVRVAADRCAGHRQECVSSQLSFGAHQVGVRGGVTEALAGFGSVEAPYGFAVPGRVLGELAAGDFGGGTR